MHIRLESPDQPEVIALIKALDDYQDSLYPPESRHALDLASLKQANVLFAVARDETAQAVGCGAVVLGDEVGELKRMYVDSRGRGQGVAKTLLALLESEARRAGCRLLRLETGPYQPEALGLYARHGYERCGPFGKYMNDPLSVFMQKALGAQGARATGLFEVNMSPAPLADAAAGAMLGRMLLDKTYGGELVGTGKGEMLMAGTAVKGSAGYVAIERVSGTLGGRSGSFVLQHTGTMNRGAPQLSVTVVPDSGAGQLTGIAGTLAIIVNDGRHRYDFDYSLPAQEPR